MVAVTPADFADVFAQLEAERAHYLVTGGVAVVLHGHVRDVADLDVVIDPAESERVAMALLRAGFVSTLPLQLNAVVVMTFLDQNGRRVDVHARHLIPYRELATRTTKMNIGETSIPVIALDDLIEMKRRTRSSDPDIEPLLAILNAH